MKLKCKYRLFFSVLMLLCCSATHLLLADADTGAGNAEVVNNANMSVDVRLDKNNKISDTAANDDRVVVFNIVDALNIKFDDVNFKKGIGLLHNDDEYRILYDKFMQQNDKSNNTANNEPGGVVPAAAFDQSRIIKLSSLYYYDKDSWGCKVNNKFINRGNQNEVHDDVSIVKVNRDNILFILNTTSDEDVGNVRKLKKSKYVDNYYIVKNGGKRSIMFRLYIGQSIDLTNLQIK